MFFLGYMLLAGRCRKPQEEHLIKETIEKIMKRKIDLDLLYGTGSLTTKTLLKEVIARLYVSSLIQTLNLRLRDEEFSFLSLAFLVHYSSPP